MALEEIELDDAIRTVSKTSRKHWKLHDVIPNANTTTPVDEQGLAAGSGPGIATI